MTKTPAIVALVAAVALLAPACGSSSDDVEITGADGEPVASGGQTVNGGLTVRQALETDATGVLAVQGNLFDDGTGIRLCEVLAESFPPQCGDPSLLVEGFDFDRIIELPDDELIRVQQAEGVTWTDGYITLFGELVDSTLVVDPLVAG